MSFSLISKQILGSNSAEVNFFNIPITGIYTDLLLCCSVRTTRSAVGADINITFNGSTAAEYSHRYVSSTGFSISGGNETAKNAINIVIVNGGSSTANTFGNLEVYIPNYSSTTSNKCLSISTVTGNNGSESHIRAYGGLWAQTSAISSIKIADGNGQNMVTNSSFYLYGLTRA